VKIAAFGSVVDSWRSAVEAKSAEIERLRLSLSELLVSQTHAARLRKEAESRAAETETSLAADKRDAEAARAAAESRAAEFESRLDALRKALGAAESARGDADANAETYKRALLAAKEDCERLELDVAVLRRDAEERAAERDAAKESLRVASARAAELEKKAAASSEGGQAKLLMLQAESSELRAKVEKRNREVRELNQMLKAWEAMRHSKDAQIEKLVERCRKFEDEAADKARAVESMRNRVESLTGRLSGSRGVGGTTPMSLNAGSVGSVRGGFPSSARRVSVAPAVAAADKENPGSPGAKKLASVSRFGKKSGSVSPASASLAAFKRKSHVPRADAVPGFRERLDSVVGR
jgi:chromosome segregation ATPase